MPAYLIDNPPLRKGGQFSPRTTWSKSRITGCTVLHTAEGVMDTVGPDTGAEAIADFIRRRSDPGSYHDIADSDSWIPLVPYHLGAYQDGTGSNGFATSISFACKTTDWARMSPEKRRGFLRQGALAFAAQQAWRKANGHPLTELRLITKAQSDAGASGFIYHGHRDPERRTDPGTTAANPFPFDEFIAEIRSVMSGTPTPADPEEYRAMKVIQATNRGIALVGAGYYCQLRDTEDVQQATALWGAPTIGNDRQFDVWVDQALRSLPTTARAVWRYADDTTVDAEGKQIGTWAIHRLVGVDSAAGVIHEQLKQVAGQPLGTPTAGGAAPLDVKALAKAINDDRDRRERDGDPTTGPVS